MQDQAIYSNTQTCNNAMHNIGPAERKLGIEMTGEDVFNLLPVLKAVISKCSNADGGKLCRQKLNSFQMRPPRDRAGPVHS